MMRPLSLALLALLCAALPARGQDHPLKIATVNRAQIYKALKETKDYDVAMNADTQRLRNEAQQKTAEIRKLIETRDSTYKPDHPLYATMSENISQKTAEAKIWTEVQQDRQARSDRSHFLAMNRKIEAAIAKIAEQEHVDLVLSTSPRELPASAEQMNDAQLETLIAARMIVYANKNVPDLSEKVTVQLDAEYAKSK